MIWVGIGIGIAFVLGVLACAVALLVVEALLIGEMADQNRRESEGDYGGRS